MHDLVGHLAVLSLLLLVLLEHHVEWAQLLLPTAIIVHHLIVRGVLRISRWKATPCGGPSGRCTCAQDRSIGLLAVGRNWLTQLLVGCVAIAWLLDLKEAFGSDLTGRVLVRIFATCNAKRINKRLIFRLILGIG